MPTLPRMAMANTAITTIKFLILFLLSLSLPLTSSSYYAPPWLSKGNSHRVIFYEVPSNPHLTYVSTETTFERLARPFRSSLHPPFHSFCHLHGNLLSILYL